MCTNFSSSLTSFSCRRIFSTLTLASFSDSRSSCVSCSNAWRSRFSFSARVRPAASSSALRRGEGRRGREEERRKRGGGKWEGEKERMKWEGGEGRKRGRQVGEREWDMEWYTTHAHTCTCAVESHSLNPNLMDSQREERGTRVFLPGCHGGKLLLKASLDLLEVLNSLPGLSQLLLQFCYL